MNRFGSPWSSDPGYFRSIYTRIEARKDDPDADTHREPGGKNETNLFILDKGDKNQNDEKT